MSSLFEQTFKATACYVYPFPSKYGSNLTGMGLLHLFGRVLVPVETDRKSHKLFPFEKMADKNMEVYPYCLRHLFQSQLSSILTFIIVKSYNSDT